MTLTNPGGIGTVASVPRLMPGQGCIIATGAIVLPPGLRAMEKSRLAELGVSKVMTMTSTYDHRVIQGAESGAFLARIEELLQGGDGFYEQVFRSFGLETPAAPVRGARRGAAERRALGGDALARPGGDLAGEGAPHARSPGGAARPARLRAGRRPGARAGDGRPDAGGDGADPRPHPADPGAGGDACRGAAAPARDVLRHDRLRDRAHLRPPAARVAAQPDRVGQVPPAAVAGGEEAGPEPPHRRGGARDVHPPRVPRREELLDRGTRRADPDARRDVRPGGRRRRARRLHGHGAPRAAERARACGRAALLGDPGRVRGREGPRRRDGAAARRHRATSSTTRGRPAPTGRTRARRSTSRSRPTPATSSSSTRSSRAARARSRPSATSRRRSTSRAARCRC